MWDAQHEIIITEINCFLISWVSVLFLFIVESVSHFILLHIFWKQDFFVRKRQCFILTFKRNMLEVTKLSKCSLHPSLIPIFYFTPSQRLFTISRVGKEDILCYIEEGYRRNLGHGYFLCFITTFSKPHGWITRKKQFWTVTENLVLKWWQISF